MDRQEFIRNCCFFFFKERPSKKFEIYSRMTQKYQITLLQESNVGFKSRCTLPCMRIAFHHNWLYGYSSNCQRQPYFHWCPHSMLHLFVPEWVPALSARAIRQVLITVKYVKNSIIIFNMIHKLKYFEETNVVITILISLVPTFCWYWHYQRFIDKITKSL